jgi:hypothetical protein
MDASNSGSSRELLTLKWLFLCYLCNLAFQRIVDLDVRKRKT